MVKLALDIRPDQWLRLTPYLQRSMSILKAPSLALQETIELALESNPFLAENEEIVLPRSQDKSRQVEVLESRTHSNEARNYVDPTFRNISNYSINNAQDLNNRFGESDMHRANSLKNVPDTCSVQQSIRDELSLHRFSPCDQIIAEALIGNLDSRGYLDASFEGLRSILPIYDLFEDSELENILIRVQEIAPAGIGARNLRECLLLQLKRLPPTTPQRETAIKVTEKHLLSLATRKTNTILEGLQVTEDMLSLGINLIKSLDPKPGQRYSLDSTTYITPDVIVNRHGGK